MEWIFLKQTLYFRHTAPDDLTVWYFFVQNSIWEVKMDQSFMKEKAVMPLVISMAIPMTISTLGEY